MTNQHWQAIPFALLLVGHVLLAGLLPALGGQISQLRPLADALLAAQLVLFTVGMVTFPISWRGLAARAMLVFALAAVAMICPIWGADEMTQLHRNVSLIAAGVALCGLVGLSLTGFGLGDPAKARLRSGLQFSLRGLIAAMLLSAFLIWGAKWLRQAESISQEHIESSGLSLLIPTTHTLRNSPAVIQTLVGATFGLAAIMVTWSCLGARTVLLRLVLCAFAIPCAAYCVSWALFRESDFTWLAVWLAWYASILAASLLFIRWSTWPEWRPILTTNANKRLRLFEPTHEGTTGTPVIARTQP